MEGLEQLYKDLGLTQLDDTPASDVINSLREMVYIAYTKGMDDGYSVGYNDCRTDNRERAIKELLED